jgi:LysM repeat protein
MRLTRRGRVVAVLMLLLLAFAAVTTVSALRTASQAGTHSYGPATRYVTVEPGETLWQIARRVAPGDDPRDTVDRLRQLNGLDTSAVQAGQRLVVPT